MVNPKLRFKADDGTEFPEWGSTTLNKQGVFIRGLSYKKQNVVDDHTKTLVLRSSNILQFGKLDCLNKCQFVNKQPLPNQILQKGDIVICMANGSAHLVGKASCYEGGYQTGNLTVGAFCSIYRQHTFPIAKYIFQTQSYLNFISENSQGGNGAISNIKPSTYEDFECSYPCLEEQRKIAEFLSIFDSKVEAKEQQLEALQETKKGLLQQIFSQQLRFKADDGTEFPEWGSTTLNKQGVFIRGLSYKKQNVVDDHTKTLVLRSSNILQFGKLDCLNKCQFVNKQPLPNQILQKGDIVICMANGSAHLVGKASCYEGGYQTGNLTVGAFCSIYRQHTFPIAKYIFQTQSYLNFISENSQGGNGAISNIKPSTYEDFECSYPCLEEQRKIAEFLGAFDEKIEAVKRQLEALREIKKGLLQQMFV